MGDETNSESGCKRAIPTISAETEILANRLSKLQPGELVPYTELSALVAQDVQGPARGWLYSARRKVQREAAVVTMAVVGQGLRRAQGDDYRGILVNTRDRGRRAATRALRASLLMPKDEYEALGSDGQVLLNTERTMLGTMIYFADGKSRDRVLERVKVMNERLAVGEVLKLMGGKR